MSIRTRAIAWMQAHKNVVTIFEREAIKMANRSRKFGINLLREHVRWEHVYEYGNDEYKFCNSFSPYIGRYLLWKHPVLSEFMRCKRTKDEGKQIQLITDCDLGEV